MGLNLLTTVLFLYVTAQTFFQTVFASVPDVRLSARPEHYRLMKRDTGRFAFFDKPSDATVKFGETHIFHCSAEGAVDISWTKDGQPSDTFIDGARVLQHRGDLVFTAVSLADSGRYSCTARSTEGDRSIEAHAVLKVDIDIDNVCGRPFHADGPDGFIVGGREADRGEFPWQAMLWDIRPARNRFFCSGSLLNSRWVITAAHCIREAGVGKDDFIVRLGRHTTNRVEQTESSHTVVEIIIHPDFNGDTYESDIALLKLSGPEVTFTEHILPICLPEVLDARRLLRSGQTGTVTGWGATGDGRLHSTTLMQVNLPVVSLRRCRLAHPQYAKDISKSMFCAGRTTGGRDACEGDSGGPFVADNDGRWVLLGIVSWGDGCAQPGKYGVYTRVQRFREWIQTKIEEPVLSEGGLEDEETRVTLAPDVTTTTTQPDPCDSNPCQHGGECFSNDAGYRCLCPEDWQGDNCEGKSDCAAYKASGQTSGVYPLGSLPSAVQAYCDMDTAGGGWTVIQRRQDGSVPFNRTWEEYKLGFGNTSGEYWLGNENIHLLTNQKNFMLRIDLQDWEEKQTFAEYSTFRVSGESDQYRLHISGYSGTAGDSMAGRLSLDGQRFSTVDRDNDDWVSVHCSQRYGQGGWWFRSCSNSFLNGRYLGNCGNSCLWLQGVVWNHWRVRRYSLKSVSMKIRPS